MTGRVRPKQSLGQNFLVDENIARNIVRDFRPASADVVVEVGPGRGILTRLLHPHVRKLIAVEIDQRLIGVLQEQFTTSDVEVLHADFLDVSLRELSARQGARLRVIGNIPYHLTSPILFKVFDEWDCVRDVTMMIQREVAQRLVAQPRSKEYGILSVLAQFYGTAESLFNVSPNCFVPRPRVTSTVIALRLCPSLRHDVDELLFRTIVKTAFGKRRKTLRNGLKYLPLEPSVVQRILGEGILQLNRRPEELSVDEFARLTSLIHTISSA